METDQTLNTVTTTPEVTPVETPQVTPETTPVETPVETPQDDLVTRVSKLKEEVKPVDSDFEGFDYKEIEKITDPVAKEQALNAYKSFQKGFNKKFQELAEIKKSLEGQTQQNANWTPERVQQLMSDQNFVSAAQSVMQTHQATGGQLTNDEYSALTDTEKQQFHNMQSQLNMITQQNSKLIQQQQDDRLKGKYGNYSPSTVDDMTNQLISGKYQATREDIHKVIDYESAVKRAYELGKQDRQLDIGQRVESTTTVDGTHQVTQVDDVPLREKNESGFNYFKRIAARRVAQSKGGQLK